MALSPVTPCFGVVAGVWLCLTSPMCLRRPWCLGRAFGSTRCQTNCPGSEVLRWDPDCSDTCRARHTLILTSNNENFVSTAQRGKANPVGQCSDLWHQCWVAVVYHSAVNPCSQSQEPRQRVVTVVWASATLDVCGWRVCRQTCISTPNGPSRKLRES